MKRRAFIQTSAALMLALAAGLPAHAQDELAAVVERCLGCIKAGDACVAHCEGMLATGDTAMARCNVTVHNMLAVCKAMEDVASYGNAPKANIQALASACARMCRDCAAACEKHAQHKPCHDCFESCKKCAAACEAYAKS